jgi:DNA-binding transcriptional regulator YdaS (Cro superfamily)
MNLADYIADMDRRQALAAAIDKSPDYLWQIATGWTRPGTDKPRKASPALAQAIEAATGGAILCGSEPAMRSDLQWMRGADGRVTGHFVPVDAGKAA